MSPPGVAGGGSECKPRQGKGHHSASKSLRSSIVARSAGVSFDARRKRSSASPRSSRAWPTPTPLASPHLVAEFCPSVRISRGLKSNSMNEPHPLQIWAWIFQIITGVATVTVLFLSLKTTRRLKTADVRMENQRRFDQLLVAKDALKSGSSTTAEQVIAYCERFWNLQNDQFRDWRLGLLPLEVFDSWMENRLIDWNLNAVIAAGVTYRKGWEDVKGNFSHTGFADFMEKAVKPNRGLERAIKFHQPNAIRRFFARLLG